MVAALMLVILRMTIGWHFLYEGVWKIENADAFSARPFLTQAKGPAAPLFYAMVPDLDGRTRLNLQETDQGVTSEAYANAWTKLTENAIAEYKLGPEQETEARELLDRYLASLESYLTENREDIEGYFGALERLEARKAAGTNGAAHEKKRVWDEQQKLRYEVNGWLSELDGMGEDLRLALWNVLADDQKARGPIRAAVSETEALPVPLPFVSTRTELLDFAVTWGLTAIGACLLVGLCTRLAALGGAAFLVFVLLTQPPWPTIYPPAPEVVGHALVVDKNFVELVALLFLATTAVGRWGGLDFFLYRWLGQPVLRRFGGGEEPETAEKN
jgi:uncharacterized membrane protein YphA (DoxX/SURF4 family)